MEFFNRFYTADVINDIINRIPERERDRGVPFILTHTGETAAIRRECFNNYLEVGFRHNAIDNDLASRLKSSDWDQFIQARNELMAAWFSEAILGKEISFRPAGSGNSVGEFEILQDSAAGIFVEVKSPWQQTPENQVWSGHDGPSIRQNVDRARRQLPNNRPTLVIVSGNLPGGLSDPFSGMIQALYGEPITQIPIAETGVAIGEVREVIRPSGLFQPSANTRISAVATLEEHIGSPYLDSVLRNILSNGDEPIDIDAPMNQLKYSFKVYHNPYAGHPIAPGLFSGWMQLVRSQENRMEWVFE